MDFTWSFILEGIFVLMNVLLWYLVSCEEAKPVRVFMQVFATVFSVLTLALIVATLVEYFK